MKNIWMIVSIVALFCLPMIVWAQQTQEGRTRPLTKSEQQLLKQAKITFEEAQKTALQKAPGRIFNWEIEKEKKHIIYSIEIQLPDDNKYSREVNVDAQTGKILSVENENLAKQLKAAGKEH